MEFMKFASLTGRKRKEKAPTLLKMFGMENS